MSVIEPCIPVSRLPHMQANTEMKHWHMICGGGMWHFGKSKWNRSLKISTSYEMMAFWQVYPHILLETTIAVCASPKTGFKLMGLFLGHLCKKNPDEWIRITFAISIIHFVTKTAYYQMSVSKGVIYQSFIVFFGNIWTKTSKKA